MNDLKLSLAQLLKNCAFSSGTGNSNTITVALHDELPEAVDYVTVQLCGKDTLTGEPVQKTDTLRGNKPVVFKNLIYDGEFRIGYCAKLKDGSVLEHFMDDECIHLSNPDRKPWIKKLEEKKKGEFTRLVLESNCWKALKGKLWVRYNGRHQLIPIWDNQPRELIVWLPTNTRIEIICPSWVCLA